MDRKLVIAEVVALAFILAVVEHMPTRVGLGLAVGLLLAFHAWPPRLKKLGKGPPKGLPQAREDHPFRYRVEILLKKLREFHAACRAVREGRVTLAIAERRIEQIETETQELLEQVTDSTWPPELRKKEGGRPSDPDARSAAGE